MDELDPATALQSLSDSQQNDIDPSAALASLPTQKQDPREALKSLIDAPLPTQDERKLAMATEHYKGKAEEYWGPGSGDYQTARLPIVGVAKTLGDYYELSGALGRYKEGKHTDDDIYKIAQYQAKNQYQSERAKTFGNQAFDFATHAPGMLAEFALSGGVTAGIGKAVGAKLGGSLAARAAGYGAQTAAMTALTPSMYIEQAARANIGKNRDPLDPRGLAPAYGLAASEMAVMGAVQKFAPGVVAKYTGLSFEGSGLGNAVGRVALEGATGPFAQAAADVVHGFMDKDAGFGTGQEILEGKYGDALQHAAMHVLQFATFGAAHEIVGGKGNDIFEKAKTILKEQSDKGATPDQAAKVLLDELGRYRESIGTPQGVESQLTATVPGQGVRAEAGSDRPVTSQQDVSAAAVQSQAPAASETTVEAKTPEAAPVDLKAQFDDLMAKRNAAFESKDDATARATSAEISKILLEHPEFRETSVLATPRKVAPEPVEGPQPVDQKIAALEARIAQGEKNGSDTSKLEGMLAEAKAVSPKAKDFMERIRARQAGTTVATPGGKAQDVRATIHEPAVTDFIKGAPHLNSDIYDLKALDKGERDVLDGMIGDDLSTRAMAKSNILPGIGSHEGVRQVAIKALAKMGVTLGEGVKLTPANVQKAAAAEAQRRLLDRAGVVMPDELRHNDAEVAARARDRLEENESLAGRWATYIVEKAKNEPDGWWRPEQLAEFNEAIGRGENPPDYLEAQQAKVFLHRGDSGAEHSEVIQEAKNRGRTPAQAEELVRQVEDEVVKQLQEEIRVARSGGEGSQIGQRSPIDQPAGGAGASPTGTIQAGHGVEIAPGVFFHRGPGGGKPGPRAQPASGGIPDPGLIDDLKKALAPATRGQHAVTGAGVMREGLAVLARKKAVAQEHLKQAEAYFDASIVAAPDAVRAQRFVDFFDPIEAGKISSLHPDLQPFAQTVRDLIDERTQQVTSRDIVESTIKNYVGHLWEKPGSTPEQIGQMLNARRPLAGREGFKKQRVFATFKEGLDAGLTPVDWNPARLVLRSLEQVDKSVMAHDVVKELTERGLWHYVGLGQKSPEGWTKLNDKASTVFAPPEAKIREYFDKQQMEGLEKFADSLGIKRERVTSGIGRAAGQAETGGTGPEKVITKFASTEEILAHEIGHVLDTRYKMSDWLKDPLIAKELTDLADLRSSGRVSKDYKDYLRSDPERMANLVAAYLHAPELLNRVAPNAMAHFEALLGAHKELTPFRDIKPSLELGQRDQMQRVAGPMLTGHYYTPEPIARIMTNYLQPGLRGNKIFDAVREFGNIQNLFQLGFGAFHGGFVTMDTQISAAALGFQQISRGEFRKGVGSLIGAPYAPVRAWIEGSKVMKEYYAPGSQGAETAQILESLEKAGGRAKMDEFYGGTHLAKLKAAMVEARKGNAPGYGGVLYHAMPALAEAISKPVMEVLVPRMKLGVFADLARYETERLGPNASLDARRQALGNAWDSVENRLGQMTYDNVFWNRVGKDLAMVGIRSVGWNVGTVREVGGGLKDIPKSIKGVASGEGITSRTAYVAGLALIAGFYGSIYQYLATGKGPEELKDLYFPKTGRKRPDGSNDRMALPSYMRDVAHVLNRSDEGPMRLAQNVGEMAKGKINPGLTTAWEMLMNEDFYGTAIRNPNDSATRQAADTAMHLVKAFEPFTSRIYRQSQAKGSGPGQIAQGLVGITPAPAYVTRSAEQQRAMESSKKVVMTPLAKKLKDQKK